MSETDREPRIIRMPRRQENRAARALGGLFAAAIVVFFAVATVMAMVAVIAGLWKFISWAVGM